MSRRGAVGSPNFPQRGFLFTFDTCETLAFPVLGTGLQDVESAVASRACARALADWYAHRGPRASPAAPRVVTVCVFPENADLVARLAAAVADANVALGGDDGS